MGFIGFWQYDAYNTCSSCLFLIFENYTLFMLCCAVHIMPMVKCLINIFLCLGIFWNTMIVKCLSGCVFCTMP